MTINNQRYKLNNTNLINLLESRIVGIVLVSAIILSMIIK
jgi:hypothetical protein